MRKAANVRNGWKTDIARRTKLSSFQPMNEEVPRQRYRLTKLGWIWLGLLVICCAAAWIVGAFDRSTELTPAHDDSLDFGFYAACLMVIVSAIFILTQSRGTLYQKVVMSFVVTPIFAFMGVFLLTAEVAALVETAQDFPAGKTRTFEGLLLVKRAYQTHGKGRSWNIQTMPIWSNIDVTQADYNFMLAHRSPDDHGTNQDEITSNGYFCAKVMLQRSGEALRVLNAGRYKLPPGSIVRCSEAIAKSPGLAIIS